MERIVHFYFLFVTLIVLLMGLLLYDGLSLSKMPATSLHQMNEVVLVAHRVRDDFIHAEMAAGKYAAFGNVADLTEIAKRLREISADFVELQSLLNGNTDQLDKLQQLTAAFAKAKSTLDASPSTWQEEHGNILTAQVRQDFFIVLNDLEDNAAHKLTALIKVAQDHLRITLIKLGGLIVIGLILLVAFYLYALRQVRVYKRLEAMQKESDELLRLAVDSVDGMSFYVNRNEQYKFCNKAYAQNRGRDDPATIEGATIEQILGPEVYGQIEPYVDRALAGQEVRFEHQLVVDGSVIKVSTCLIPHFDDNGQVQGFFGQLTDITEFKLKESLLLEKSSFKKAILDSARISIITTDREGIIHSFNVGAEQKLGYRANELIGQATPVCFHDEQEICERAGTVSMELGVPIAPGFEVLIAKASRGYDDEQEWIYIHKDGSRIPVFLSITALRSEQEEIIGYLCIAVDITQQKQTEAELIQAYADAEAATLAKSAFLATMSHEIRTPMNGVLGMVEVLARSPLNQHQTEIVQTIRESAGVLLSLIDDILDFSKIEAGRLELEKTPLCVREVAEETCTSLLPFAASKGVDLRLFVSPDIPEQVLGDDVRLRQVLYNLLGNAIKFSGDRPTQRGQVQLRAEVAQATPLKIVFRVIDNGVGIPPEALEVIMSAFTQAEASTTRHFGGTGLGLAICKRIVEVAQGDIQVESTLGAGSTFTVTLPFTQAPESAQPELPDLAGLECIVIGSPRVDAADLGAYLMPQGARVNIVADLDAAAKLVTTMAQTTPVVIVRDAGDSCSLPRTPQAAFQNAVKDAPHVRQLLLTHGRRRQARIEAPGVVSLDIDALPRCSFLHAVAVAASRASLEQTQSTAGAEPAAIAPQPSIAEAYAQGRLVLVAEDNTLNQKVILHQLGTLGYAAEIASSGAEALCMWRTGRYALLLTDLQMPELDGYGLATAIRAEESATRRTPILALTANALRGESGLAISSGMDGYLTKPVQLDVLQKALEKWMPLDGATPTKATAMAGNAVAPDAAAVDINVLKALVGGDETTVYELLAEFQTMSRQEAAALHQSFDAGNIALTAAIAHKLKSSSRSIGALRLGDACAELENAGKAGHKDAVERCVLQFDAALAAVDNELNSLLAKQT